MRRVIEIERARPGAIRVNAGEVEIYLFNGWSLTDEPDCSGARMLPPAVGVNRVSEKSDHAPPGQKKSPAAMQSRPGKKTFEHGFDKRKIATTQ